MRIHSVVTLIAWFALIPRDISAHSTHSQSLNNVTQLEDIRIHTPSQRVTASAEFELSFALQGQDEELTLRLEPNDDILLQNSQLQYLDSYGKVRQTEAIERTRHKVFKGGVWIQHTDHGWDKVGWARIYMIRDGENPLFEGAFSVSVQQYHVKLVSDTGKERRNAPMERAQMAVYHDSQASARRGVEVRSSQGRTCAVDQISTRPWKGSQGVTVRELPGGPSALWRRQTTVNTDDLVSHIGSTAGCPTTRRVALVGIATDCTYTASFSSTDDIRRNILNMVNTASEVFESTFNISLSLHNLTISDADCPSSDASDTAWNVPCSAGDLSWRLQRFSSWRGSLGDTTNAYWTLMTGCPTGEAVGISLVGELCDPGSSTNVVAQTAAEWQVFAHESAHTFGAVHDCESSTCSSGTQCCPLSSSTCGADAEYLMNPYSTSSQHQFSPCTVGNVCFLMGSGGVRTNCLVNNDSVPAITTGQCGNGIVEADEDCDCGSDCDGNSCCDGSTCRFRDGAVCDDAAGPCCTDCQFVSAETVCRASIGSCDIQETCPGNSSACPTDRHVSDGQSCGSDSSFFCANGQCTNRDVQCREQLNINSSSITSCDSSSCTLSCSASWYGSGYCTSTGQQVLDGTPCSNGHCLSGQCQRSSGSEDGESDSTSWVDRHRSLIIGLCCGIGGALLLAILICIVCGCFSRSRPRKQVPPPVASMPFNPYPPYPPPAYRVTGNRPVMPTYA